MEVELLGAADTKSAARTLIQAEHKNIPHIWHDNTALIEGSGHCCIHKSTCAVSKERPDICCGGLPCQPFSRLRAGSRSKGSGRGAAGQGSRSGAPCDHPDYVVAMKQFGEYLSARRPSSFMIEEVMEFNQDDPISGQSFLWSFASDATSKGFAVRALSMDHATWCELPRGRIWVIGIHQMIGGATAADWCVGHIQAPVCMSVGVVSEC